MGWVRIDDSFYDHAKFHRVGALGLASWIAGLAYCNRNLTDGFIPHRTARGLIDTDGLGYYIGSMSGRDAEPMDGVSELVSSGLWEEVDGGYQIHDYLDYQPSAVSVRAEREKNALRKAAWRASHKGSHGGTDSESPKGSNDGSPPHVTGAPNPNPNPEGSNEPSSRRGRKSAAPDVLPITEEMQAWADEHVPNVDLELETQRFLTNGRAKDLRYVNWRHAWRNWMTNGYPKAVKAGSNGARVNAYGQTVRSDIDKMFG